MATRTCWGCKARSHHTVWAPEATGAIPDDGYSPSRIVFALATCDECYRPSIALDHVSGSIRQVEIFEHFKRPGTNPTWLPVSAVGKNFPDVPEHIASTASEAHSCHSIGAHRGALALARTVVEAIAKDHGHTRGGLESKINALADGDIIRPRTADLAHQIRFFGNSIAHGDFAEPVEKDEAAEVLALMDIVLDEVYQIPARLARTREAYEQLKRTTQE